MEYLGILSGETDHVMEKQHISRLTFMSYVTLINQQYNNYAM